MYRTTLASSIIFLSLSSISSAESYVGGSLDLGSYSLSHGVGVGASAFGGGGAYFGTKKNIYLGGELGLDYLHRYSLGVSFIPGLMVTKNTMIYGRFGLDHVLSHYKNDFLVGTKLGVGVQTKLTKHWDFRTEYVSSYVQHSKQINAGFLYKFD